MSGAAPKNAVDYRAIGKAVAEDVAAVHADDVDARARFPHEAIDRLREERMLSAMVPVELASAPA